jgi:hypothetical protein
MRRHDGDIANVVHPIAIYRMRSGSTIAGVHHAALPDGEDLGSRAIRPDCLARGGRGHSRPHAVMRTSDMSR